MSIAQRLVNFSDGLSADGVLSAAKGGTGNTTGGGTTSPTISQISYGGDDTATDVAGGGLITLTGTNFASGAKVLINTTPVGVVTVVSSTQITFTAPQLAAGSYILYVVNLDGSTAIAVPGIQYSGTPAWSTAAGTLGTGYETSAVSTTVSATSDSAVSYSVVSGTLPSGVTINASGTISGTSPLVGGSTTYTFTVRATDAENQDTDRQFSLTINPDVVTWSAPANGATLTGGPGIAYTSALSATSVAGQTVSYSADALPAGLAISGSTITGTPTAAGTSSTTLTATSAVTNKSAQVTISWTISIAADTYFPYTTLLLNSETVATPFLADASVNNFAVTAVGDTKPSNFGPYLNNYSYFSANHSTNYLSFTPNAGVSTFTGDFTVEAWVVRNTSAAANNPMGILEMRNTSGSVAWTWILWDITNGSGNGALNFFDGTNRYSANTIKNGAWFHVAITRQGSTIRQYINGVQDANTFTLSGTITGTATTATIGRINSNAATTGYISNLRVVNGTAVYTSTFTPPTQPLTAVSGTTLLTCQSNRFRDASTNNLTITRVGDAVVSSFSPFVPDASYATYGSTYFDGTGDYLTVPTNSAFSLTGNFTIECWLYPTAFSNYRGIWSGTNVINSTGFHFGLNSAGNIFIYANSSFTVTSSNAMLLNTWNHVAVVRNSGVIYIYINGILSTNSWTTSTSFTNAACVIGTNPGPGTEYYIGSISDFRIVNGTAVYTANFTPPTAPLTAVTGTSLLTCQTNQPLNNQTFLDNSSSAFPITSSGNATQGSFSPYGANWSNYFDGTGDYLTAPAGTAAMGTGDFTVELWAYHTASGAWAGYYYQGEGGSGGGINFRKNDANKLSLSHDGVVDVFTTTASVPINQWTHIALTRSSGTVRAFIDGVLAATTTYTGNFTGTSGQQTIGSITSGVYFLQGYISNFRVVKGTAVYTSAFTPPTQPLTAITGTEILTCQSASFIDNSPKAITITKFGDTSTQKFSPFATVTQTPVSHSVYFDGSGDYLTSATGNATLNTALDILGVDYTVEFWMYKTANTNQCVLTNFTASGVNGWQINTREDGCVQVDHWVNNTSTGRASTFGNYSINTWVHIAVVKLSGNYYFYINGTEVGIFQGGTRAAPSNGGAGTGLGIGTYIQNLTYPAHFNGYLSNLRVVKGTAVYTSNFTPPTSPLTAIAGTSLLTCQSSTLIDNSINNFAITAAGNAIPRRQNPFGSTTSSAQDYTPAVFGSSAYFDGSGDYLNPSTASTNYNLTGDFTMEAWVYPTRLNANDWFPIDARSSGATANPWLFGITNYSSGGYKLRLYTGSDYYGTSVVPINIWTHIAWERNGSALSGYVNGVREYYNASFGTGAINPGSTAPRINSKDLGIGAGYDAQGYMSDIRLVNGSAVYKGSFVPPTTPLQAVQNTTLLLNMDRAAIQDKSGKAVLETVGDAKVSTSVRKYGSSSMSFDGTGDTLRIPASAQFQYTGDYTVEFWVYFNSVSTEVDIVGNYISNVGTDWMILKTANGTFQFYPSSANSYITGPTPVVNTWYHIAGVRSGTSLKLYVNGVSVGTPLTFSGTLGDATKPLYVGSRGSTTNFLNGYIDDLRISRYARYTANFTPPAQALLTK